jgi:hypothetical protein
MSNLHHSKDLKQVPRGESQYGTRTRPRNPWLTAVFVQFRHAGDGRKWRIVCREKRKVMRAFVLLGPESTAREIAVYQGIGVRRVEEIIRILKSQGFLTNGLRTYRRDAHGLRDFRSERQRRILHPDKLLPISESCGPRRESCGDGSSSVLRPRTKRSDTRAAKTAARRHSATPKIENSKPTANPRPLRSWSVEQLREPAVTVQLLNILAVRVQGRAGLEQWPMKMLAWVLRGTERDPNCQRRVFHPGRYVQLCVENFLRTYNCYQQWAILGSFYDLPGVHFNGQRWVQGNPPAARPKRVTCPYCRVEVPKGSIKSHTRACREEQQRQEHERVERERIERTDQALKLEQERERQVKEFNAKWAELRRMGEEYQGVHR